MKKIHPLTLLLFFLFSLLFNGGEAAYGQCSSAYIKIDGNFVLADNGPYGIALPYWLTAGQTLAADQNVNSISVMVFAESGTSLTFSKILSVTSVLTVPVDTVWKIESISKKAANDLNLSPTGSNSVTFAYGSGSSYTWTAPSCVYYMCADVWGAGGAGGSGALNALPCGGGGGGAYLHICSAVTPGTTYAIAVGEGGLPAGAALGGSGGNSTITIGGTTYTAGGGSGGPVGNTSSYGTGGAGGTTTNATIYTNGAAGGNANNQVGGAGGSGGNGGRGGDGTNFAPNSSSVTTQQYVVGMQAQVPGGGGGGAGMGSSPDAFQCTGLRGADGRVTISW